MILVDTSVWIGHLREGEPGLVEVLNRGLVFMHPFVIGELACGNLRDRETVLTLLQALPKAPMATEDEALFFINRNGLMGKGIGYIDVHLLASVSLAGNAQLWTRDKRLHALAVSMILAFPVA